MANRLLIIAAVLFWYATVRMVVYHRILPAMLGHIERDDFDWWFAWLWAIPITAVSIAVPGVAVLFILYG